MPIDPAHSHTIALRDMRIAWHLFDDSDDHESCALLNSLERTNCSCNIDVPIFIITRHSVQFIVHSVFIWILIRCDREIVRRHDRRRCLVKWRRRGSSSVVVVFIQLGKTFVSCLQCLFWIQNFGLFLFIRFEYTFCQVVFVLILISLCLPPSLASSCCSCASGTFFYTTLLMSMTIWRYRRAHTPIVLKVHDEWETKAWTRSQH